MRGTTVLLFLLLALFSIAVAANPPLAPSVKKSLAKQPASSYKYFEISDNGNDASLKGNILSCRTKSCYVLTLDDGVYDWHRKAVDFAVSNGIKLTFFVNIFNFGCTFDLAHVSALKYAYSKGMQIGTHTATHPNVTNLTNQQLDTEIELVEDALWKILGVVPRAIRLPYGAASRSQITYLNNRHGLVVVGWNNDVGDASGNTVAQSKDVIRKVNAPQKAIFLMHETHESTVVQLLPFFLQAALKRGYKKANMKTVADSIHFNPYKVVGKPQKRDASWNCDAAKRSRCSWDKSFSDPICGQK